MTVDSATLRYDSTGLAPAVVQDASTGSVLMVGYMNREAVTATLTTRLVTFWSRSRQELWQKGKTSGNRLQLVDLRQDCDADTLLVTARQTGPACHTGDVSCFGDDARQGFFALDALWSTIAQRARELPAGSYTAELVRGGVDATARKVAEEATEVVLAAKNHAIDGDPTELVGEAADLIYHLLVTLAERGVEPSAVMRELERRS